MCRRERRFFAQDDLRLFENDFPIVGQVSLYNFAIRIEVGVGLAHDVVDRCAEMIRYGLIDEDVPAFQILHEDEIRIGIDDASQERLLNLHVASAL